MIEANQFQDESTCPRCGRHFSCGVRAGKTTCWCADLPRHLPLPQTEAGCLCPDCLKQALADAGKARRAAP